MEVHKNRDQEDIRFRVDERPEMVKVVLRNGL
jgi:hypothetical protein